MLSGHMICSLVRVRFRLFGKTLSKVKSATQNITQASAVAVKRRRKFFGRGKNMDALSMSFCGGSGGGGGEVICSEGGLFPTVMLI